MGSEAGRSYQCHQIPGVFASEFSAAAEHDERHEEDRVGDVVRPAVLSYKLLDVICKGEDGNEGECHHQLNG